MILVHTWVETKTRQQCKDLMYPWGKYIYIIISTIPTTSQVPRKPKQHLWQIPKDPCMVYIPAFGLRSKFMEKMWGKYSSPMEHLGIGNLIGLVVKQSSTLRKSWRWNYIPSRNWRCWGFLKCWYPTTMGFPTKKVHFGVFWGYHHLRKHPCIWTLKPRLTWNHVVLEGPNKNAVKTQPILRNSMDDRLVICG